MKNIKVFVLVSLLLLIFSVKVQAWVEPTDKEINLAPTYEIINEKTEVSDQSTLEKNSVESGTIVNCSGAGCDFCNFLKIFQNIFYWLLSISFASAIFLLVLSGFSYVTALGKNKLVKFSKRSLKYALIGFSVCLLSWLSVYFLYKLLGFNQGRSWWQIECNRGELSTSNENQSKKSPETKIQYKNEVLMSQLGGRENPINLKDLPNLILSNIEKNKYFFIHGLGGQPSDDTARQLVQIINEVNKNNELIYTVLPTNIADSGKVETSQLVNLNNYIGGSATQSTADLKKLISQVIIAAPSTQIPLYIGQKGTSPSKFSNDWPEIQKKVAETLTKGGVVYSENKAATSESELKPDLSYVTLNFNYDSQKGTYSLNQNDPLTFDFPAGVSQSAIKEATVAISETVSDSVSNKNFEEDALGRLTSLFVKNIQSNQIGSIENTDNSYYPGVLPTGLVKGGTSVSEDTLSTNTQMAEMAKQIIQKEAAAAKDVAQKEEASNDRTGIISEISSEVKKAFKEAENLAPNIPIMPILPEPPAPSNGTIYNPKAPSAPTPESLQDSISTKASEDSSSTNQAVNQETTPPSDSTIRQNVSAVDNYDISDLKYRVSTDRVLDLEDREKIRNMLEGLRKEIADNGQDLNIPTDFLMCIFQKESSFDAAAISETGCSGIGQMCMGSSKIALKQMEKYAPEHFKEFSAKVAKEGKGDLKKLIMGGHDTKKRELLRSDPNLCAALSYALLDSKKRGDNGNGKPIKNDQGLRSLANNYGPGDSGYANSIMQCYQNNGWRK